MSGANKKGVKGFQSVEEGGVHTGTEAWNIAQYFTGFSIALPLKELNDLEDIARFGTLKMDEDLVMSADQVSKRRAEAVKRYWQKLKQILIDTVFKVKKEDKEDALKIFNWVLEATKYLDALTSVDEDHVTHEKQLVVNEGLLVLVLDALVKRKKDYLFILDRTGLIFKEMEEVDLEKMANDFVNGG